MRFVHLFVVWLYLPTTNHDSKQRKKERRASNYSSPGTHARPDSSPHVLAPPVSNVFGGHEQNKLPGQTLYHARRKEGMSKQRERGRPPRRAKRAIRATCNQDKARQEDEPGRSTQVSCACAQNSPILRGVQYLNEPVRPLSACLSRRIQRVYLLAKRPSPFLLRAVAAASVAPLAV